VRRTDVALRAAYPQLQTRIFQIGPFAYRIVFDEAVLRFDAISDEFENNIRPLTLQVGTSNEMPPNFLREIPTSAKRRSAKSKPVRLAVIRPMANEEAADHEQDNVSPPLRAADVDCSQLSQPSPRAARVESGCWPRRRPACASKQVSKLTS
jgi:hypothetical protein